MGLGDCSPGSRRLSQKEQFSHSRGAPRLTIRRRSAKTSSPVQVKVQFDYRIRRFVGQTSESEGMTLVERSMVMVEKRETTCQLFFSELKDFNDSYMLLSGKLLKLGVKPSRHKGIIKKIVNCGRKIVAVGSTQPERGRVSKRSITVEIMRIHTKWRCDNCSKVRARNLSIKKVIKGFRVGDDDHREEVVAGEGDRRSRTRSCSICLEEFVSGTKAVRLPCLHEFHDKCILTWLLSRPSCPLCRFEMPILIIKNSSTCPFR